MASKKKLLQAAAGSAAGAGLDIDEAFSTFLYTTDGTSSKTITNNIDLSGEGGLVWLKRRSGSYSHSLYDTERGVQKQLQSDATTAESTETGGLTAFTSTGFTIGNVQNQSALGDMVAWTFRKAPKFFDVVTYTGTGSAQNISHNLGSVPGMILVKKTNGVVSWNVFHRSLGATKVLFLNTTNEALTQTSRWNDTEPTSTQFTVGTSGGTNDSGDTYVAYLFAHNNSDGEFGPDADQDIIKCGSYTPDGSGNATINLGFEPQFLLIKCSSLGGTFRGWAMFDAMRGVPTGSNTSLIQANLSDAENQWFPNPRFTPTGFETTSADQSDTVNSGGQTYIYMAIRRGPLAEPTSATDVFKVDQGHGSNIPNFESGFPVDFGLLRQTSADGFKASARLTSGKYLETSSTAAESSNSNYSFDYQDGWVGSAFGTSYYSWMWKRAPGYFDVVTYTGTGSARTVSHNLGVAPEMMWVKRRTGGTADWQVYHSALGNAKELHLNLTDAEASSTKFNSTDPTSSVFSVGTATSVNRSGDTYIAYLFATLAGISKVGSYTGTGSTLNIDCGFSSGARFVLIKRTNDTNEWTLFDTARGIVAGNDPYLYLSNTDAQVNAADFIDPYSAGFSLTGVSSLTNENGSSYIFYAIA